MEKKEKRTVGGGEVEGRRKDKLGETGGGELTGQEEAHRNCAYGNGMGMLTGDLFSQEEARHYEP